MFEDDIDLKFLDALDKNSFTIMGHKRSFDKMADIFFCVAPNNRHESREIMKSLDGFCIPKEKKIQILKESI